MKPRHAWWWLAAAAVHVVLLALYHWPAAKAPLGDERMYLRAAVAVAETGHSELASLWPPAYAWFLAPLVAAGGGAVWVVQLAQTALLGVAAYFVRRLVYRELDDAWAANLAALLVFESTRGENRFGPDPVQRRGPVPDPAADARMKSVAEWQDRR